MTLCQNYEKPLERKGIIHSLDGEIGDILIYGRVGEQYHVKVVETGVHCQAIQNPFNGLFYADDIYTVINM